MERGRREGNEGEEMISEKGKGESGKKGVRAASFFFFSPGR